MSQWEDKRMVSGHIGNVVPERVAGSTPVSSALQNLEQVRGKITGKASGPSGMTVASTAGTVQISSTLRRRQTARYGR